MEFLKSIQEAFAPEKFISQAEKNTQAVLAYVQPAELSKTLVSLTSATTDFVQAQVKAVKSITEIATKEVEEFTNSLTKAVK